MRGIGKDKKICLIDPLSLATTVRDITFITIAFEMTFQIAMKISKNRAWDEIGNLPLSAGGVMSIVTTALNSIFGLETMALFEKTIKSELLNDEGLTRRPNEPIANIQYFNKEDGFTKFVYEAEMKIMFNPMMSQIANTIFDDHFAEPSKESTDIINTLKMNWNIGFDISKHSLLKRMISTASKVELEDLQPGNKDCDALLGLLHVMADFDCRTNDIKYINTAPIVKYL